jgi:hypothetical protein
MFSPQVKRKMQSDASGDGSATDLEHDMMLAVVRHLDIVTTWIKSTHKDSTQENDENLTRHFLSKMRRKSN